MAISTASAKQKGRKHQQWVRDQILDLHPTALLPDDVKSTSSGAGGEDVQLSPAARRLFNYSVECKAYKAFAFYKIMEQAASNAPSGSEPLVIIKGDRKKPLAVVDAEHFLKLTTRGNNEQSKK